jgi:hypothetical protein
MYLPTQLLYERPATPVVYDTPPVITRPRPLLLRALDMLRRTRRPAVEAGVATCTDECLASSGAASG